MRASWLRGNPNVEAGGSLSLIHGSSRHFVAQDDGGEMGTEVMTAFLVITYGSKVPVRIHITLRHPRADSWLRGNPNVEARVCCFENGLLRFARRLEGGGWNKARRLEGERSLSAKGYLIIKKIFAFTECNVITYKTKHG